VLSPASALQVSNPSSQHLSVLLLTLIRVGLVAVLIITGCQMLLQYVSDCTRLIGCHNHAKTCTRVLIRVQ
jgi:hypothetical protein